MGPQHRHARARRSDVARRRLHCGMRARDWESSGDGSGRGESVVGGGGGGGNDTGGLFACEVCAGRYAFVMGGLWVMCHEGKAMALRFEIR